MSFQYLVYGFNMSDISFSLFNRNLNRLHPNLFTLRKSDFDFSISFVTFTCCILSGFLLLSGKPSIPFQGTCSSICSMSF